MLRAFSGRLDYVDCYTQSRSSLNPRQGREHRLTPDIGIINDFSWNVVNGDENHFGMVRGGVRFAF